MALTEQDREWVKAIVGQAVANTTEKFAEIQMESISCLIKKHTEACPHGKKLEKSKAYILGIVIGIGLVSGGSVFALAKIFAGL